MTVAEIAKGLHPSGKTREQLLREEQERKDWGMKVLRDTK